jgi:hypothetical protein
MREIANNTQITFIMPTQASYEEVISIARQYYLDGYAQSVAEAARIHDVKE